MKSKLILGLLAVALFGSLSKAQTVTYYYVVTAVDAIGDESVYSNQASCAYTTTAKHCLLTWNASTSTVVGYNVYRSPVAAGGTYTKLTPTAVNALTYTDAVPLPLPPSSLSGSPQP